MEEESYLTLQKDKITTGNYQHQHIKDNSIELICKLELKTSYPEGKIINEQYVKRKSYLKLSLSL